MLVISNYGRHGSVNWPWQRVSQHRRLAINPISLKMADGELRYIISNISTSIKCSKLITYMIFSFCHLDQDQEVTYEEVVEGPAPHVIETGDSVKVKQVLDDATSETLIENGFVPNYFWENLKLFFMFLSCVFAMIAQFYPIQFPDSRPLLGFCCAMYFLLSTVLQGMITYIDKDIILIGKADEVRFKYPQTFANLSLLIQSLVAVHKYLARLHINPQRESNSNPNSC